MSFISDAGPLAGATTPARPVTRRRIAFAALTFLTWAAMLGLAALALSPGGFGGLDIAILILAAIWLPWSVFCFWNAAIGFLIMRFARDPVALTCPPATAARGAAPITATTSIAMCVRNEDTGRVFRNLGLVLDDLARTGLADKFRLDILSDTNRPDIAAAEEAAFAALRERYPGFAIGYRRRQTNPGFKAGNVRDFLETTGRTVDFALVLDADSFMSADRILRMVRIMQADPKLGILQSLTVGLPSTSPLARLFQFGMRLGMRSYTLGSAWWHADCGPFWGHNAILRTAAFADHCHLPRLSGKGPLAGDIMSHDQVEAVLMRRAGYDVRVVPEEGGSFEENPPTLVEFIRRDMRWCMGNLQYLKLVGLPGLKPASRFQLVLAIVMFIASPTYLALWSLVLLQAHLARGTGWIAAGPAWTIVAAMAVMMFAPKIASALDVLSRRAGRESFGGTLRFLAGLIAETVFSLLLTPISAFSHTLMMGALLFGRTVGWTGQQRDAHAVPWGEAAARFWPHSLAGLAAFAGLMALSPVAALAATPLYLGLLVAIPFTVLTSSPAFGRLMTRLGWCRIPEEVAPPVELSGLALPALAAR